MVKLVSIKSSILILKIDIYLFIYLIFIKLLVISLGHPVYVYFYKEQCSEFSVENILWVIHTIVEICQYKLPTPLAPFAWFYHPCKTQLRNIHLQLNLAIAVVPSPAFKNS